MGSRQLLIGAIEFFDFIFVIIDLMARFYRNSFNSDRNVSDTLSQDSSSNLLNRSLTREKEFLYHRSIMFHVVE